MTIDEKKTYVENLIGKDVEYVVQNSREVGKVKSYRLCEDMNTYLLYFENNSHTINCDIVKEIK